MMGPSLFQLTTLPTAFGTHPHSADRRLEEGFFLFDEFRLVELVEPAFRAPVRDERHISSLSERDRNGTRTRSLHLERVTIYSIDLPGRGWCSWRFTRSPHLAFAAQECTGSPLNSLLRVERRQARTRSEASDHRTDLAVCSAEPVESSAWYYQDDGCSLPQQSRDAQLDKHP